MTNKLYIVATPVGNLEDITLRALRVLKDVDLIFAEDTRVAKKLLAHFGIGTPIVRRHTRDEQKAAEEIIVALDIGKNAALISDAGTPGISDPGSFIVAQVRKELPEIKIEVVPGPSALAAAISVAGVSANEFLFLGFLPHKKGRETLFKEIAATARPVIFYESPHRILKTLESLKKFTPEKKITICRELTKIYEEVITGSAAELVEFFTKNSEKVRGEFVVLVSKK
ncbi:MAG: 16S rRNA (cytidine(1402)-2'-O)-methyltransferase [Candidatus Paceibacterota bacterium]|jgi:16S rRNA (cytidine1402-2'-O)-methyltransferase